MVHLPGHYHYTGRAGVAMVAPSPLPPTSHTTESFEDDLKKIAKDVYKFNSTNNFQL